MLMDDFAIYRKVVPVVGSRVKLESTTAVATDLKSRQRVNIAGSEREKSSNHVLYETRFAPYSASA